MSVRQFEIEVYLFPSLEMYTEVSKIELQLSILSSAIFEIPNEEAHQMIADNFDFQAFLSPPVEIHTGFASIEAQGGIWKIASENTCRMAHFES